MLDTAAHLVDRVIPDVPVRQRVLSPPHAVRYRVAYDSPLLAALIQIFIRAIFSSLRRRARASYLHCREPQKCHMALKEIFNEQSGSA